MDDPAGDGVDRISALPGDLLHIILARLRRALEVTRTAALSRRWRRVWIHARDLSLVDDEPEYRLREVARDSAFIGGFLDWVLSQRGDADMDSLLISMKTGDCPRPDQIDAWIRYGTQRVVGDFYLRVAMGSEEPYLTAVKLPEHGRPSSISLHLSCHGIQFPPRQLQHKEKALE
uniref:F-box domain-containing protein n=1 Tax=Setaria italica TaxID=4555 RepID=K3XQW4_SETIT